MEFHILGPVEAVEGGGPVALGAPKQRAVLVALLLRRNRTVTRDQLAGAGARAGTGRRLRPATH